MNKRLTRWLRRVRGAVLAVAGLTSLLLAPPAAADVSIYFDVPYFAVPFWGYYAPRPYYAPRRYYPPPRYYGHRRYRDYGYRKGPRGYGRGSHNGRGYGRGPGPGRGHARAGPRSNGGGGRGRGGRGGRGGNRR